MIDINLIRNKPEAVKNSLLKRNYEVSFDELLKWDEQRRELIIISDQKKAERNRVSRQIPIIRHSGEDVEELLSDMKSLSGEIKSYDDQLKVLDEKIKSFLEVLPNLPAEDVVAGGKENNLVVRTYGSQPEFDFEPKNHIEIAESLSLIDYKRGAKLSGNGFWIYTGKGALLEWALLNYFITEHLKDGYRFMLPPHMLTYACGYTAGQFPKFIEEDYKLDGEGFNFMIPTSETALSNIYRDEIVNEKDLPVRLFAYTPCFRKEAGSYRAEERGMIRGHQFNKVEMFCYTKPEKSAQMLNELIYKAESLVQGLGLHYQLAKLAAGDVSPSMAATYDIEVWLPSMNEYKEVSSISNAHDYQARRGAIRFKRNGSRKTEYVHTLNGSGLATSRVFPAILEQYQQKDGSVIVPEPLRKFTGFEVIKK